MQSSGTTYKVNETKLAAATRRLTATTFRGRNSGSIAKNNQATTSSHNSLGLAYKTVAQMRQ